MSKDEVMSEVKKRGAFIYTPNLWSEQADKLLQQLEMDRVLRLATAKEYPMNWEYTYVLPT